MSDEADVDESYEEDDSPGAGPLDNPDRGHLAELIIALLIAVVLVSGLVYYVHRAPVGAKESAQPSQVANEQLNQRYRELLTALHQLPVNQIIVFGDTNNPIQWQRIR